MKKLFIKFFIKYFARTILVLLMLATIFIFLNMNQVKNNDRQSFLRIIQLRKLIQALPENVFYSLGQYEGNTFKNLQEIHTTIDSEINFLQEQKLKLEKMGLSWAGNETIAGQLKYMLEIWSLLKPKLKIILENQEEILKLKKTGEEIIENLTSIEKNYYAAKEELAKNDVVKGENILQIDRQIELAQGMVADIHQALIVSKEKKLLQEKFYTNTNMFSSEALLIQEKSSYPSVVSRYKDVGNSLNFIQNKINFIKDLDVLTNKTLAAILSILTLIPLVETQMYEFEINYIGQPVVILEAVFYILISLTFLWILLLANAYYRRGRYHLQIAEEKDKNMQLAIEKLLKDLPNIANGNTAEVLDKEIKEFTINNMIAGSFSYALNTIRKLIYSIAQTTKNISVMALDAQKITQELATSSGNQAQEIAEITASVNAMATSIEEVSANALESATVALESVNIAGEGGKVVRSTISGMERIQSQIQETSTYMRRLSDSSQEIGEIVSLIDGIADQTNILSLNASIQAAMAGEAGRGFAVVADEVQRLAEKVSYATKEIGSLVRSIQTDTSQVINAMEQTKAQVLEGVTFAQDAGSTLEKIETVSRHLSDLIQNISSSASEQATVSGKISHMMNDVKDIAKQTAFGTMTTVGLIEKLLQYANELRQSAVKLKEDRNLTTGS